MVLRRSLATAGAAAAASVVAAVVTSVPAETAATAAGERPRGAVESCSEISGFGASSRDFTRPANLVVGPLAVLRSGRMLEYAPTVDGNKVFVVVRGGHRVTIELSLRTRRDVGLGFGAPPSGIEWTLQNARRVVSFVSCRRGEYRSPPPDGWPVSGWVGFLLARSPRCVPLRIWVDDEPTPRHAVVRFGVRDCG